MEVEVCKLCKKPIDTLKDEWATIIEYASENQTAIGFYHKLCLKNFMSGNVSVIKDKFEDRLKNFTHKILGSIGGPYETGTTSHL